MASEGTMAALHPLQHYAQSQLFPLSNDDTFQPVGRLHANAAVSGLVNSQWVLSFQRPLVRLPLHSAAAAAAAAGLAA